MKIHPCCKGKKWITRCSVRCRRTFFVVSNEQRINYGLWYSAETLRRNLGAYGEYVSHFFRCLVEDLDFAVRGERISSIYTYLEMPLGERDEVLDYALGDLVLLLGRAIDTPPP